MSSQDTEKKTEVPAEEEYSDGMELTAFDRCDACSAGASGWAVLPSEKLLLFCGHHFDKHEPALREQGAQLGRSTQKEPV